MSRLDQPLKPRRTASARTVLTSVLVLLVVVLPSLADDDREAFFETKIRPVLISRCFECHGQGDVESGLRVDSREALLKGGDSGAAIVVGDADGSLLVNAIRHSGELKMPPQSKLSPQEIADFERWIHDGAVWPSFDSVTVRRSSSVVMSPALTPDSAALKPALQVWLQADGQPWQDGQPVHLWEDRSGRGHDLVATAGGRTEGTGRPATFVASSSIAGFPAVHFEMDSGLGGNAATAPEIAGDDDFTMIIVARVQHVPENTDGLIAGFGEPAPPGNPGRPYCAILGIAARNQGHPIFVGGWGNDASPAAPFERPLVNGSPLIIALGKSSGPQTASSSVRINGVQAGLFGHNEVPDFGRRSDLGFFMGHARSWLHGFVGDVAEVALFNRQLTTEELGGVETHFSAKYRIPLAMTRSEQPIATGDPAFQTRHWAFEPLSNAEPPESGPEHPIDRFVAAKWREKSLTPVGQADARTLVRRLYFDLIGLPPTPEQMAEAVATLTPWSDAAWSALIDALLASPHYGERWGRHWLDVARYADTAGDNADYPIPEARLYRDYVIDSFNNDKPYDQFVREQLAGDILAADGPRDRYAEQVTATGFLALSRRYATGPYELWHLSLEDTIDTVGQAFMGLSLRCARCHDHKFDPVSQREYYGLYGIFESTQYPWAGAEEFASQKRPRQHFVSLLPPAEAEPLRQAFEQAAANVEQASEQQKAEITAAKLRSYPAEIPSAYAVREGNVRPAVYQFSGDSGKPGPVIDRSVPQFLDQLPQPAVPAAESGRRQLAEWLTHPDHPLTARVMVNRIWQHHFGQGIVATPSNFGARGVAPTHPKLLDWLSRRFIDGGWSIKQMHRLVLTSQTWRLSSGHNADNAAVDPSNEFLWQHSRQRLDAESIRDSLLAISGRLDLSRPDGHPFPPITSWGYTQHNQFRDFYPNTHRSVYLMTTRLQRHPFLSLFDGPDTNTTTDQRKSSIVPSQALYLMNGEVIRTEAAAFAERVLAAEPPQRISRAYSLAFQREPTSDEASNATAFIDAYSKQSDERSAWIAFCRSLLISHETFYVD